MKTFMRLVVYALIIAGLSFGYLQFQQFEDKAIALQQARDQVKQDKKDRLAKANAMFKERCKQSGYFIHKTVKDVEEIFLMKIRLEGINRSNQFKLDDPYGSDHGGEGYIESILRGSFQANTSGVPAPGSPPRIGYHYVEAIDPADGQRYRYTGSVKVVGQKDINALAVKRKIEWDPTYDINNYAYKLDKTPAPGKRPRYGVTYDDISTREEREYWIAGSSLKVIDLETKEILAERIGYMMDYGQGSRAGHRSPWLFAADNACPGFQSNPLRPIPRGRGYSAQARQTQDFIEQVLIPKLEN